MSISYFIVMAAILSACTAHSTIEEITEIDANGTDPLAFTCITEDSEKEPATRAGQLLNSDFMVSTYKAYQPPKQYPVMERYHVEYKTSGTAWDGNQRPYWDYTKVSGQYEKYWDYANFPYRFHAIAPYPTKLGHSITLGDASLSITAPYQMQQVHNGMVTPIDKEAEPYVVAQMQRDENGHDWDYLATSHPKEINTTSTSRNRYVALPFHHLNAKVRFGIYCTAPWATANSLYIEGLTIKVASPNFITQAAGYTAGLTLGDRISENSWYRGSGNSGFTNPTVFSSSADEKEKVLLSFDGGKEVTDNDLSLHQGRSSAFWLQCPNGIMQIPQTGVRLYASLSLKSIADGKLVKEFTDVPIHLEDGTTKYNWISGYIHTYYLIIGDIPDNLELTFTATLTPWEDISGSLSTDLEQ